MCYQSEKWRRNFNWIIFAWFKFMLKHFKINWKYLYYYQAQYIYLLIIQGNCINLKFYDTINLLVLFYKLVCFILKQGFC